MRGVLARAGAKVALLARDEGELEQVASDIEASGGEALVVTADISKEDQLKEAYKKTLDTWGRLDLLLANAGINGVWAPIEELSLEEWQKTIDVNLTGTFLTVKHAFPHLKKQGGAVVITASVNGTRMFSNTGATAYASTKAAQVAFAKMTALEFAEDRVRVNVICPGAIETDIEESTDRQDYGRSTRAGRVSRGEDSADGRQAGVCRAGCRPGLLFAVGWLEPHQRDRGLD